MNLHANWISARAECILQQQPMFHIKAVFNHVINLESDGEIIAVQTAKAARTPFAVQVSEQQFAKLSATLRSDRIKLTVTGPPAADCRLPLSELPPTDQWLMKLRKLISTLALSDSFAFLVDPLWTTVSQPTPLQCRAHEVLEEADGPISKADFRSIARTLQSLSGLGQGLTPAGDDFLIGVLAACTRFPHSGMDSLRKELGNAITKTLDSCTWLSKALLACAAEGEFSPSIHDILTAQRDTDLARAVSAGIAWGHTSGADTLGGILWALQTAAKHK